VTGWPDRKWVWFAAGSRPIKIYIVELLIHYYSNDISVEPGCWCMLMRNTTMTSATRYITISHQMLHLA